MTAPQVHRVTTAQIEQAIARHGSIHGAMTELGATYEQVRAVWHRMQQAHGGQTKPTNRARRSCGTTAAYIRHIRRRELPDQACCDAWALARRLDRNHLSRRRAA